MCVATSPAPVYRQVWRASESLLLVRPAEGGSAFALRAQDEQGVGALREAADQAAAAAGAATIGLPAGLAPRVQDAQQPPAAQQQQGQDASDGGSHFDSKTDKGSADLYFHYYGCLQHQQNMLQDYIRTGEGGQAVRWQAAGLQL